jgi:hypothetical protein
MQFASHSDPRSTHRHQACTDQVIGAILSGWRYDISGIPRDLRGDYDGHLRSCGYCKRRQRVHRTVDVLLLAVTSLSFAAFLLTALVLRRYEAAWHRYEAAKNIGTLHLHLPTTNAVGLAHHIPSSITISLEAVAIAGVVISMLLWVLVAIATPVPGMLAHMLREHFSPEIRERKQAA